MKKIVSNVLIVSTQLIIGGLFLFMLFSDSNEDKKNVVVKNDNLNKMADSVSELFVADQLENMSNSNDTKVVDLISEEEKKAKEEQARISQYFIRICELVFHVKYGIRCAKCGKVYDYQEFLIKALDKEHPFHCECYKGEEGEEEDFDINIKYRMNPETKKYEILINGITITSEDFDRLRQIVMYQNLPDFKDDTWVDPDMRADQAEKQRLLAKKNNAGTATLERKIVCVSAKSCYKIEDIYKLTMRKFLILLSAIDDAMNYECTRIGLMTGMVSMKEPVEHWIYKKESDDLYGGEAVSLDDIQENISSA